MKSSYCRYLSLHRNFLFLAILSLLTSCILWQLLLIDQSSFYFALFPSLCYVYSLILQVCVGGNEYQF